MNTIFFGVPERALDEKSGGYKPDKGEPQPLWWGRKWEEVTEKVGERTKTEWVAEEKLSDGDIVNAGEEIMLIELNKNPVFLKAPATGVLTKMAKDWWVFGGKDTMLETPFGKIGSPALGTIEVSPESQNIEDRGLGEMEKKVDESAVTQWEEEGGFSLLKPVPFPSRTTPLARKVAEVKGVDVTRITGTGPSGKVTSNDVECAAMATGAVPAARAKARAAGLDLARIKGTGEGGLIQLSDVEKVLEDARTEHTEPAAEATSPASATLKAKIDRSRAHDIRRYKLAHAIPVGREKFTTDVTHLSAFLKRYREFGEPFSGTTIFLDSVFALYAAQVLKRDEYRTLTAYCDLGTEEIVLLPHINIGIAVNTPRGLRVVVVHNAEQYSPHRFLRQVSLQIEKAKGGTATNADFYDTTFTVNNTGALGGEDPESLLTCPDRSDAERAFDGKQASIRPTSMMLNLPKMWEKEGRRFLRFVVTFDHGICDGTLPTDFAKVLRRLIEEKEGPEDFAKELSQ